MAGIHVREERARTLAALEGIATSDTISGVIGELYPKVYEFLKTAPVRRSGQNIVVYLDVGDELRLVSPGGLVVQCGVEVDRQFDDTPAAKCVRTPAGKAACATHVGPYSTMSDTHVEVRKHCHKNGLPITGVNWEIYADPADDPSKLETEVVYQLK